MKGSASASGSSPSKRRWKGFALGVLTLVVSSLLVPLVFLLGLHQRLPYSNPGYLSDDGPAMDVQKIQIDVNDDFLKESSQNRTFDSLTKGVPLPQARKENKLPSSNINVGNSNLGFNKSLVSIDENEKVSTSGSNKHLVINNNENEKACQLQFGSYCLWSVEHKEKMKDSMVKKLKDQLFVARAYYPIMVKLKSQEKLSDELKWSIQDHERMLSVALIDADLPLDVKKKIKRMEATLSRSDSLRMDCNYVDKKLRQILDLTEDEAHFHRRQSAFLYRLSVQTMPKSLHCLSMRLTVEYFKFPINIDNSHAEMQKINNPTLQHYAIFSRNILASSVVINSTVMNTKGIDNLVFHLLTDDQNYFAMKFWFSRNLFKGAVVHVENIDVYALETSYGFGNNAHQSMSEEFRISIPNVNQLHSPQTTEYISVFGHAHFLLPEIFKKLRKLVLLGDDVVVQQDLSPLWNVDLKEKVIGAVEFCKVQLGQLKSYLVGNEYDSKVCAWISGLSIVDLEKWREFNVSKSHQQLLFEHMKMRRWSQKSRRTAMLATTFLAFQHLVYPLNESWLLSGLGTNYGISTDYIRNSPVLHYNGNMKPWLDLGISKYKRYWRYYLAKGNQFMDECNVNP